LTAPGKDSLVAAVILVLGSIASGAGAAYPRNTWLQVGPVVLAAIALPYLLRRWPVSRASLTCAILFLLIHLMAAHWTYSDVPYDRWLNFVGIDIRSLLGTNRNMFDRLVHFSFGLLAIVPIMEFEQRYAGVNRRLAFRLALLFVLASSALYEIFEWLIAVTMSPDAAEAYNGQQGDAFDSQKDMAIAAVGAMSALLVIRMRDWMRKV
jgi:putative membrane protein